jgi:hypothetical protein
MEQIGPYPSIVLPVMQLNYVIVFQQFMENNAKNDLGLAVLSRPEKHCVIIDTLSKKLLDFSKPESC